MHVIPGFLKSDLQSEPSSRFYQKTFPCYRVFERVFEEYLKAFRGTVSILRSHDPMILEILLISYHSSLRMFFIQVNQHKEVMAKIEKGSLWGDSRMQLCIQEP